MFGRRLHTGHGKLRAFVEIAVIELIHHLAQHVEVHDHAMCEFAGRRADLHFIAMSVATVAGRIIGHAELMRSVEMTTVGDRNQRPGTPCHIRAWGCGKTATSRRRRSSSASTASVNHVKKAKYESPRPARPLSGCKMIGVPCGNASSNDARHADTSFRSRSSPMTNLSCSLPGAVAQYLRMMIGLGT